MAEDETQITSGDWFVHAHFGVGQVKGQEVKCVAGQEQTYYEIETAAITLWLPHEQMGGGKIRPLTDHANFRQVIDLLKRPPKMMPTTADKRKKRIAQVKSANTPQDTARLVRDLWARQRVEGQLYDWEREAWRDFSAILIQEWAISQHISPAEARRMMTRSLHRSMRREPSVAADESTAKSATPDSDKMRSLLEAVTEDEQKWSAWLTEAAG